MSEAIAKNIREEILTFEEMLKSCPESFQGDTALCPLTHEFANGIYVRTIRIPAGTILTGKIHKHAHPNVLLEGTVEVYTEAGGMERLKAPLSMISKSGTKRVVHAITDVVWQTFHNVGDEKDLKKIENIVIAPSYEEYERQLTAPKSLLLKAKNYLKKFKI